MTDKAHRILVVGGFFGCRPSSRSSWSNRENGDAISTTDEIFLINHRAGLIRMNKEKLNINFATVDSTRQDVIDNAQNASPKQCLHENLKVNFTHGKCIAFTDERHAQH